MRAAKEEVANRDDGDCMREERERACFVTFPTAFVLHSCTRRQTCLF